VIDHIEIQFYVHVCINDRRIVFYKTTTIKIILQLIKLNSI